MAPRSMTASSWAWSGGARRNSAGRSRRSARSISSSASFPFRRSEPRGSAMFWMLALTSSAERALSMRAPETSMRSSSITTGAVSRKRSGRFARRPAQKHRGHGQLAAIERPERVVIEVRAQILTVEIERHPARDEIDLAIGEIETADGQVHDRPQGRGALAPGFRLGQVCTPVRQNLHVGSRGGTGERGQIHFAAKNGSDLQLHLDPPGRGTAEASRPAPGRAARNRPP